MRVVKEIMENTNETKFDIHCNVSFLENKMKKNIMRSVSLTINRGLAKVMK